MTWWWLSFLAQDDGRFLGIAVVWAISPSAALLAVKATGCHPTVDAEVLCLAVPPSIGPPPAGYAERLLTEPEMRAMQALWTPDEPDVRKLSAFADEGDPDALAILGEQMPS